MPLAPERKFDPSRPLVVRRFFVAAGRHWRPGDAFDWTKLSIAQRRVAQLFDNGKLMHVGEAAPPVIMPQAPSLPPQITPEPTVEQEVEDEAILQAAAAPADELEDMGMVELREIAQREGAPFRVSREAQREAIRENRRVG